MPVNLNKPDRLCRLRIDKILVQDLPEKGQLLFFDVVRECLLGYDVSDAMVKRFIRECYIDTGLVILEGEVLKPVEAKDGA